MNRSLQIAVAGMAIGACLAGCNRTDHPSAQDGSQPSHAGNSGADPASPPITVTPRATVPPAGTSTRPAPAPLSPGGTPTCRTSQLGVSLGRATGAAGTTMTSLVFVNHSAAACRMDGHPGVSFVAGSDGHQTGHPASRNGTPRAVVLQSGERAHATLRILSYQAFDRARCQPTVTKGFRVYPPDQTSSVFVPAARTACADASPAFNLLTVDPVNPGAPTA